MPAVPVPVPEPVVEEPVAAGLVEDGTITEVNPGEVLVLLIENRS